MRKGSALLIVGMILFILGLGLTIVSYVMMGSSVEEYDDWVSSSSREHGDEITVTGKIADKDGGSFFGLELYSYKFEGSDKAFISGKDWANKGDTVTLIIEINNMGMPEATGKLDTQMCLIPGIIMLVLGIILLVYGFIVRRKEPKLTHTVVPNYNQIPPPPPYQTTGQPPNIQPQYHQTPQQYPQQLQTPQYQQQSNQQYNPQQNIYQSPPPPPQYPQSPQYQQTQYPNQQQTQQYSNPNQYQNQYGKTQSKNEYYR